MRRVALVAAHFPPSTLTTGNRARSRTISRRISRSLNARSMAKTSASILNGLAMKSHAPARTAATARSMLPNAVISSTS